MLKKLFLISSIVTASLYGQATINGVPVNIQNVPPSAVGGAMCVSTSGNSTTYTCTSSITSYSQVENTLITWIPDINGAGGATTLNIHSLGAISIKNVNGSSNPLSTDIVANQPKLLVYNGTSFLMVATATGSGSGGGGINSQTISYTLVSGDSGKLVTMNGSTLTASLPSSAPSSTWYVSIENLNSSALTISRNGLNINGVAANLTLQQYQWTFVYTDGTNYFATVPIGLTFNADGSVSANKGLDWATSTAPTYNSGGTTTVDFSQSNTAQITMSGGNSTLVVNNPHGVGLYGLEIIQDSTCRTFTYPGNFVSSGSGSVAEPSCDAASTTFLLLWYDGTNFYQIVGVGGVPTAITGPERTAITSTITSNGALTFDSASHTVTYFANNSANRHIIPRTFQSSGDQLGFSDLAAAPPFVTNPQTATYQVLASDFTQCKTIPVASGTFTITLVASGSQPVAGQCVIPINYGSGVVTIARSGQNINGGTSNLTLNAGSATAPTGAFIWSDGTNYFALPIGAASSISWATPTTGTATSVATFPGGDLFIGGVNSQTGTSYAFVTSDELKLTTFNNSSAVAVTLSQATTTGFTSGALFFVYNLGTGTVTITPSTSTINGSSTLVLTTGQGAIIVSNGTNYLAIPTGQGSGSGSVFNGSTNQSVGTGSSPITETWTVGTGGVTQYTLVQTDSSAPTKIISSSTGVYGVAMSTVSAAGTVEVARYGTVNCVADNSTTAGDLVIIGTSTVIDCKDSGQTSSSAISITNRIIGVFRTSVSGGANALVELTPAHYGTLLPGGVNGNSATNVTPANVTANTTSDQEMMELTLSPGYLNNLNQAFLFNGAGVYSTPVAQTPTLTFKVKLCTVSGCGTGTVVTLASITSGATLASSTNSNWNLNLVGITATIGSSGDIEIHGHLSVDLGTSGTVADTIYNDTNTAVSSTIDLTGTLYVDYTVATSTGSASNSITQREGGVLIFAPPTINHEIAFHFDGSSSAISGTTVRCFRVPYSGTITGWYIDADQSGSATFGLKKVSFGSYTGSAGYSGYTDVTGGGTAPTLSSAVTATFSNLTSWVTAVTSGNEYCAQISSPSTITWADLYVTTTGTN